MQLESRADKWRSLGLLASAELLAMSLWFSASAVVPQLQAEWGLDGAGQAWLTLSVQLGFVVGALASAILNLPDRLPLRQLIAVSTLAGAAFNLAIPWLDPGLSTTIVLRGSTGVALAGVYPPGMKLVATWTRQDRGLAIGVLVGALTLGSASPHLLNALPLFGAGGMPPWRSVLATTSGLALFGAAIVALCVRSGPYTTAPAPFDIRAALQAFRHRPTRLANFGYLGHMWELYAMWAWTPIFLLASYEQAGSDPGAARLAGFSVIGIGAVGCVLAGRLADRFGRTTIAATSLAISGSCALGAGFLFDRPVLLTLVCLLWGFAVVADSAQFSAAVTELADPRYVGTALTVQTTAGFLLTLLTIRLVPLWLDAVGWQRVFMFLAIGPALGVWSMLELRRSPEATRLASGHR